MNSLAAFAAVEQQTILLLAAVGCVLLVTMLFLVVWASRYRKVGPDQVLVVSGRKVVVRDQQGRAHACGFRLVKGGGTFVFPVVGQASVLSLKPFALELKLARVVARSGGSFRLDVRAQARIKPDDLALAAAAGALLGKTPQELKELSGQILEDSLRELVGSLSAEQLVRDQGGLPAQLQASAEPKLAALGLGLVSFALRELALSDNSASVGA